MGKIEMLDNVILQIHTLVMIMLVLSFSMFLEQFKIKFLNTIGNYNLKIYIYSWPIQSVIEIVLKHMTSLNADIVFIVSIGANSVVLSSISEPGIYVGSPAHSVNSNI